MNNSAFWKSDWLITLVLALLFGFAHWSGFGPLRSLESGVYDFGLRYNAGASDDRIVLLTIDEDSIERLGRWPWPRKAMADMVDKLSNAGAQLIGVDILFIEEQQLLASTGRNVDMDSMLANAVRRAGNVALPILFDNFEERGSRPDAPLPEYINRMAIESIGNSDLGHPISAGKLKYPFPRLAKATAALGHINTFPDDDGVLRSAPMAIEYYGKLFPSFPLALAARQLNLSMRDVRLSLGERVELGRLNIATDDQMRIYPTFYAPDDMGNAFKSYSFYQVYADRIPASKFRNKIVLIGVTAKGIGETFMTPVKAHMSGVELTAHFLNNILHEEFFTRPVWTGYAEWALLALIALYLMFLMPRLGATSAAVLSLLLLAALIGSGFFVLTGPSIWLQTMTPASMLLFGHVLLTTKRYFASEQERVQVQADSAETNKMLGLSFQSQGMLDMAFDKFRKCPVNDDVLSILYNLGMDFERKRQFNKATAVYEYMAEHNPTYKDIPARIERCRNAGETMIFGSSTGGGLSTMLITGGAKPTLGRYEITKELGKGAMGTVYLGKDPKINREVAIKTMALSQEFEADELEEVKERFFREAETAGRLNHPNIVTIYDAGEEHDLAYIAMEFLKGTDLVAFTKKDKLVSPAAVLKIAGKVAEALSYAHGQGVVHRDIKPANIMLLKDKTVKVTDFGIARITASSKTKTGVVLGTPSYMSPEQLSGKHVDGRSDLFSLGVMIYEMLTAIRPFRGDSMATLMFQIANEPHPDIREYRSDLPESIAKLIDKALAKEPEARYESGAAIVRDIIKCLQDLASGKQTA